MKIDLHLHTNISSKNGDSIRCGTPYETLKILFSHKIKIASFTDHNAFDLEFYLECKKIAKDLITILPGVEINVVKNDGKIAHLLVIFSNDLSIEELEKLKMEISKIYKNGISINEINNWFQNYQTIRIPHVGKSDFFEIEDLEKLNYDAIEITNDKHPNYLKFLKSGIKKSVVSFSDTHIWDNYPQNTKMWTEIDELESMNFDSLKKVFYQQKNYFKKRST